MFEIPAREATFQLMSEAVSGRRDLIIDMGHALEDSLQSLRELQIGGYSIHFHYVFCPPEIAIQRAAGRERFTSNEMIESRYHAMMRLLPDYIELADHFTGYDNSDLTTPFQPMQIFTPHSANIPMTYEM